MEMDQKEFSKDIEFQDLTSQELADPEFCFLQFIYLFIY